MTEKHQSRRYPRVEAIKPVPVAWIYASQKNVGHAENLSLGGLFIATPAPLVLGSLVMLLFHTPEGEVRVRATVRNVQPGKGMGLAITSMEPEHRARLSRWLLVLAKQVEDTAPAPANR